MFFGKVQIFVALLDFFYFYSVVRSDGKVNYISSFSFFITRYGLLVGFRWSVCISKSLRILCTTLFRTDSSLCIYPWLVWSDFNFLHNSQWITVPTLSCLVLYPLCACLLPLLFIWLNVLSLSPLVVLLRIIDFSFNIIGPYGVVLWCYLKRFSFTLNVSLS